MKENTRLYAIVASSIGVIIIIGLVALLVARSQQNENVQNNNINNSNQNLTDIPKNSQNNPIRLFNIKANDEVGSPLEIEGEAKGTYYFEASFPVKIVDSQGNVLATSIAQAQEDWMTVNYVPFKLTLEFNKPSSTTGEIIFEKDNPSGLPENSESFRVPIRFKASEKIAGEGCIIDGCSGQICRDESSEGMTTTCEYKAEYGCFKYSKCEQQKDGKCGWTQNTEFTRCVKNAKIEPILE